MAWYPPYIGTGLKVESVNETATAFDISMKLRWYNRNIYGTHFGGSLYSMCDPWFAFAVSSYFGQDYIIWDKSASIKYLKPGKGRVKATFAISQDELTTMKKEVDINEKGNFTFSTNILGPSGEIVAEVIKEVYVRRKKQK